MGGIMPSASELLAFSTVTFFLGGQEQKEVADAMIKAQKRPPPRPGSAQDAGNPRLACPTPGAVSLDAHTKESAGGLAQGDRRSGPGGHPGSHPREHGVHRAYRCGGRHIFSVY